MAYGTDAGYVSYCAENGYDLGDATEAQRDQQRARGSVFVDSLGWRMSGRGVPTSLFPGIPTDPQQALQWPREGASDAYGRDIPADVVPSGVERASYEAAHFDMQNPGALNEAQRADQRVTRERFGSVEFQYADGSASAVGSPTAQIIPAVMTHLAPLMGGSGNRFGVTLVTA